LFFFTFKSFGSRNKDKTASLFDAESEVYQQALIWTCVILAVFLVISLFYELITRKSRDPHPKKYGNQNGNISAFSKLFSYSS
jgi:abortive infection bacteriophage resistance protein